MFNFFLLIMVINLSLPTQAEDFNETQTKAGVKIIGPYIKKMNNSEKLSGKVEFSDLPKTSETTASTKTYEKTGFIVVLFAAYFVLEKRRDKLNEENNV